MSDFVHTTRPPDRSSIAICYGQSMKIGASDGSIGVGRWAGDPFPIITVAWGDKDCAHGTISVALAPAQLLELARCLIDAAAEADPACFAAAQAPTPKADGQP